MKIEPVKRYPSPRFPAYEYLLDHPELINKVPERWRNNKLVLTTVSALAMMIVNWGCTAGTAGGLIGGPPLITESQAQTIIRDESSRAGLNFISDSLTIDSVRIPLHLYHYPDTTLTDTIRYTPALNFTFDGHDTLHHITYEFISFDDEYGWKNLDSTTKNKDIDIVKTARDLQNQFRQQHEDLHSGVFYEVSDELALRQQVQDFIAWLRTEGII